MAADQTSAIEAVDRAWRDAIAEAAGLALAEGEASTGRAIADLPRPTARPGTPSDARRAALLTAALLARSTAQHWDVSRRIADLPGGPSFARSLAPWEAWRLAWTRWSGKDPGVLGWPRWRHGGPPADGWAMAKLLATACLRPPRIRRAKPSTTIHELGPATRPETP